MIVLQADTKNWNIYKPTGMQKQHMRLTCISLSMIGTKPILLHFVLLALFLVFLAAILSWIFQILRFREVVVAGFIASIGGNIAGCMVVMQWLALSHPWGIIRQAVWEVMMLLLALSCPWGSNAAGCMDSDVVVGSITSMGDSTDGCTDGTDVVVGSDFGISTASRCHPHQWLLAISL